MVTSSETPAAPKTPSASAGNAGSRKRTPRDPDKPAPKRYIRAAVPDGHTRIYFDIPDDLVELLKDAAHKDDRELNDFARVTVIRAARQLKGNNHA